MVTNVIAIIAILITVSSAAWYKTLKEVREEVKNSSKPSSLVYTESAKPTLNTLAASANAVYINRQTPGATTTVDSILLEAPGFVAVHEDDQSGEGKPGKIIGASALLPKGESRNISVPLSRVVHAEEKLWVSLHLDSGDKKFNIEKDKPALNQFGYSVVAIVIVKDEADEAKIPPETPR